MKAQLYRVTDHPHLVKDAHSKAILNTDPGAVARHEQRLAKVQKEQRIQEDISNLKSEMSEIKHLLMELLGKKNG